MYCGPSDEINYSQLTTQVALGQHMFARKGKGASMFAFGSIPIDPNNEYDSQYCKSVGSARTRTFRIRSCAAEDERRVRRAGERPVPRRVALGTCFGQVWGGCHPYPPSPWWSFVWPSSPSSSLLRAPVAVVPVLLVVVSDAHLGTPFLLIFPFFLSLISAQSWQFSPRQTGVLLEIPQWTLPPTIPSALLQ